MEVEETSFVIKNRILNDKGGFQSRGSQSNLETRMHSSRMRTGRALTVFRSLLLPGGGYLPGPGEVWSGGGVWSGRGSAPGGGVPAWSQGGTCLVPGGVPG